MRPEQFRDQDPDHWTPYIDVNLFGVLHCVKATLDGMCERGWGRIITISSSAGTHGAAIGVALYAAGKGAGISFMRHVAVECARFGVTANTLALGLMARADADAESARTVTSGLVATIPVGRLGTGTDVGHACVYLASDEASWMTGQTIGLNGGWHTS
jgi:NAD(P)-dependent dehydrogenase (short-subunit alcohol dehydrogenase family)